MAPQDPAGPGGLAALARARLSPRQALVAGFALIGLGALIIALLLVSRGWFASPALQEPPPNSNPLPVAQQAAGAAQAEASQPPEPVFQSTGAPPTGTPVPLPIPEGLPLPVYPAGEAAFGRFELGGEVNQTLRHPDLMRQAGMTWVKYRLVWEPGQPPRPVLSLVEQGHAAGFKVLISVVGGDRRPRELDIPSLLEFLSGVAYYGPDAVEVWSGPNHYFQWPRGQIDGDNYVRRLLAPAYNAIKRVDPTIMVISGAPIPGSLYRDEGGCSMQGYGCDDWRYLEQMAQAGAVNYMDCVGVHYNTGATTPSAGSGHPADSGDHRDGWYFGGMLDLYGGTLGRPVCFTQLGYLSGEGYGGVPDRYGWAAGTTAAEQAAWLAEAALLSRQTNQVRLMVVWNVDFLYWGEDDPAAGYAILRPDGSCPACATLGAVMRER